mgnify:CR=1 FL=1
MAITTKDLNRLSGEIRKFINKTDIVSQFGTTPTLALEFPSMGSLINTMQELDLALSKSSRYAAPEQLPWKELGNGIYELTFGGVRIILLHVSNFDMFNSNISGVSHK